MLKAGAVLVGAYLVGTRAVPWVLGRVAGTRTRELFLLAVVGLALGTALLTQAAGLSLAFGAFLAGLVVGESEYRAQVVAEVLPLRDLFASLFFVSIGLLIDPRALLANAPQVALLTAAVVVGKTAIIVVAVVLGPRAARDRWRCSPGWPWPRWGSSPSCSPGWGWTAGRSPRRSST